MPAWRERPPRPRRRLLRLMLALGVGCVVAAGLAPSVLIKTPLFDSALQSAIPPSAGRVTVADASFGWITPLELRGVAVTGVDGAPLAEARRVALDRTLWDFLTDKPGPIVARVEGPVLRVQYHERGSNAQDFLARLATARGPSAPTPAPPGATTPGAPTAAQAAPPLSVELVDGALLVSDPPTRGQWQWTGLEGSIAYHNGLDQMALANRSSSAGSGALRVECMRDPAGGRRLAWQATAMPLAAVAPAARAWDPSFAASGVATSTGTATWGHAPPAGDLFDRLIAAAFAVDGTLTVEGAGLRAAATRGAIVRQDRVEGRVRARSVEGRALVEDLRLTCGLGAARVTGTATAAELRSLATGALDAPPEALVSGELDLAKLAAVAPRLLSVRDDARIESGTLTGSFTSTRSRGGGADLSCGAKLTALRGVVAGRNVAWKEPVDLSVAGICRSGVVLVESVRCEAEFLSGRYTAGPGACHGVAQFDLDRLSRRLGEFIDLGAWTLEGQGEATFDYRDAGASELTVTAAASLAGVRVARAKSKFLDEPKLELTLEATGVAGSMRPLAERIARGKLKVRAEGDALTVTLKAPGRDALPGAKPPVRVALVGDLAQWRRRVDAALVASARAPLPADTRVAGAIDLEADVTLAGPVTQLAGLRLAATNLRVESPRWGLRLLEPQASAEGDLLFDSAGGRVESRGLSLATSAASLAARDLRVVTPRGAAPGASGELALRADLARLAGWWPPSPGGARPVPAGSLSATATLATANGEVLARVAADAQGVALNAPDGRVLWREPRVQASGDVALAPALGGIALRAGRVTAQTLTATLEGGAADWGRGAAQLGATADYDLAAWTPVLAAYAGPGLRAEGRHQARFVASRAPGGAPWTGRMEAPWTAIDLYGLPIGPGTLVANLTQEQLVTDPLAIAVAGGQLTSQPVVQFRPAPAAWRLPPGPLLTAVEITPEVSDRMLKYFAPVLAGATRSQGKFSLALEGAAAPLDRPRDLDAAGRLTVHSARVVPGPATAELVSLVRQVEAVAKNRDPLALVQSAQTQPTLLAIEAQEVDFRVVQGRVHHRGFEFQLGDATVRSAGSVGFDETLDLRLTVPIQEKWIAGERLLVGLRGQSVVLPVTGTFSKPRIDKTALSSLSRDLVRNGVGAAVENELGRALEKVLGN